MLRIIDGQIGAGKTYYAVDHVLRKYYRWSDEVDEWVPKDSEVPVLVVTNISECRLGESFDELVDKSGGLSAFFHVDNYQRGFCKDRRVVYIIDEAQKHFHRKFFDRDVFFFFQYHRHLGVDVYLITQDVSTLAPELRNLAEYYIHAARRTHSFAGEFRFQFKSGPRERAWKTVVRKRDPRVFAAYQSMVMSEGERAPNVARRFALLALLFLTITAVAAVSFVRSFASRGSGSQSVELAVGHVDSEASAAASKAWASWAASYVGAATRGPTESGLPPPPLLGTQPGNSLASWSAEAVGVVLAVYGDGDDERLWVEVDRGDGWVVRLAGADAMRRCRCAPSHLRPGQQVRLGRAPEQASLAELGAVRRSGASESERSGALAPAGSGLSATTELPAARIAAPLGSRF